MIQFVRTLKGSASSSCQLISKLNVSIGKTKAKAKSNTRSIKVVKSHWRGAVKTASSHTILSTTR